MKLSFNITEENIKQQANKFKVLKNPIHLKILLILRNKSLALDEVFSILYKEHFYTYRESTYKALEKLVKAGFLTKSYNPEKKKIVYSLAKNSSI